MKHSDFPSFFVCLPGKYPFCTLPMDSDSEMFRNAGRPQRHVGTHADSDLGIWFFIWLNHGIDGINGLYYVILLSMVNGYHRGGFIYG